MREDFDWLSIKIGINDIHRQLGDPANFSVRSYAEDYRAILDEAVKKKPKLILIDPFYISTDRSGTFRTRVLDLLADYLKVVESLAKEYNALHVKTQKMFEQALKTHRADEFCPEPVHPYRAGHLAIALELYKVLGGKL